MSVREHRIAAVTFLVTGTLIVFAWGRSQANESGEIRAARGRLEGRWIATSVRASARGERSGPDAARTGIDFDGRNVVFRGLIEGGDARGTYLIDPKARPPRVDFKLDAGWVIGVYEATGDRLILNVVPLALPEQLGVPTRYRPRSVGADKDHNRYAFRRGTP